MDDVEFIRDSLFQGGNDYSVKELEVRYHPVNIVRDTKNLIHKLREQEYPTHITLNTFIWEAHSLT